MCQWTPTLIVTRFTEEFKRQRQMTLVTSSRLKENKSKNRILMHQSLQTPKLKQITKNDLIALSPCKVWLKTSSSLTIVGCEATLVTVGSLLLWVSRSRCINLTLLKKNDQPGKSKPRSWDKLPDPLSYLVIFTILR